MLNQLVIQNLAIAENLDIQFHPGLNIITGETGAGKSLLVDALSFLRGARADLSLIRTGTECAVITGFFQLKNSPRFLKILNENGIPENNDDPEEIVIKRILQKNGKHRALINDSPVSTKTLQAVAEELVDISSQFDNQKLLDPENHTFFLDEYAGTAALFKEYHEKFQSCLHIAKEMNTLTQEIMLQKREKDLFAFELSQIASAGISVQEFEHLERILYLGNKSIGVKKTIGDIENILSHSEQSTSSLLHLCKKNMEKLNKQIAPFNLTLDIKDIDDILILIDDLQIKIEALAKHFDIDELEMKHALERIEVYNKLLQKFGPQVEDILTHQQRCQAFLNKMQDHDNLLHALIETGTQEIRKCLLLAEKLSCLREEKIGSLALAIEKQLGDLGMPKAKFACLLENIAPKHSILPLPLKENLTEKELSEFSLLSKFGAKKAQFLLSANTGMELYPIEKVVSGGELSRIMLAIKSILFVHDAANVFVFDEIDTGISGNIASKVGRKIAQFCQNTEKNTLRQAICITHLPQVACYGQSHFIVSKVLKSDKTMAKIKLSNQDERIEEIAIMLSGQNLTQESIAQAKALIKEAN